VWREVDRERESGRERQRMKEIAGRDCAAVGDLCEIVCAYVERESE